MIRFLQRDNRLTKALFVVIIAAASVSMVVYLIPGLTGQGATSADTYAVIYPHWYSRFLSSGDVVSQQRVQQIARQQIAAAESAVRRQSDDPELLHPAGRPAARAAADSARRGGHAWASAPPTTTWPAYLHTGPTGEVIFPNGKYIGDDQYATLVNNRLNMSVAEFEDNIKRDIVLQRLRALITAGVTVSDQEIRATYRKDNIKIKFDYAVLSSDDLRKTINPSDADLEAFFKKNAVRYATAVPEQRKITYFAFTPEQLPGGVPQPSQQEIQAYYTAHQTEYSAPEQATSRHILIKLAPDADAKTDAAAKAKAEDILKQLQSGGNLADLAKKNSDDPGSKDTGGELGFSQRGRMVPEFDNAIFTQKIGDIKIVKSQFGYHIVQVEERQPAHVAAA